MSWVDAQIGEFVDIKHGFAFKGQFFREDGEYVVLTPGNCHNDGGFKSKGDKEKRYTGDIPEGYLLNEGDLLVVMTDLVQVAPVLGGAFIIPQSGKYLHNQRLGLVSVKEGAEISRRFLYHLFNTHDYRGQVRGSASGATVRHTSPDRIKACHVKVPDLPTQERIASILSAYDDLIENNRRRIALLEQAARLLYREWFVHFRFPGYETAKFVGGLPEGWEKRAIGDHCPFVYGKALRSDTRTSGLIDVYGSSGIVGSHNKPLVKANAIIVGRKGNVGSVFWAKNDFWPIDTVYYIAPENSDFFTYFALLNVTFINTDVAVPGLNRDFAHSRKLCVPDDELLAKFNLKASGFMQQIRLLSSENEKLTKARDLLLPRLMDGRISVTV